MARFATIALSTLLGWTLVAGRSSGETIPMTGEALPGLDRLDRLMTTFIEDNEVPGAALAVARRGRLVYARGFGYADRETKEPVRPDSLFRIASISKSITAFTVLTLVDRGRLGLDDKVLDVLAIEPKDVPGGEIDPRWRKVTIRHLLQHNSGWNPSVQDRGPIEVARSLGMEPPPPSSAVVRWMFGQPLEFEPGTRHAYANFGYRMLARVVEKSSGRTYEGFVRADVLSPMGISRMRIGRSAPDEREPGEVRYYARDDARGPAQYGELGKQVSLPYTMDLASIDGAGGWIASAVDLVRFSSSLRAGTVSKVLMPDTFRAMLAAPEGPPGHKPDGGLKVQYYGCGWMVSPRGNGGEPYIWHNGGMPGTSTVLVHRHGDEFDFAVLFNTGRGPKGNLLADDIPDRINRAIDAISGWPDDDRFPQYP